MRKILLLLSANFLFVGITLAQTRTVTGVVTDNRGTPLPNVSVVVRGQSAGTSTDANGSYSISVPPTGGALVFSFVNYVTQQVNIGTSTTVNASLQVDERALAEVV